MTGRCLRIAVVPAVTLVLLGTNSWAQSAVQGEAPAAVVSTEFHSPMIITTVLAATEKSFWQTGHWFSAKEYQALGKFTCDGVSLRQHYKPKHQTWNAGLQTLVDQMDAEHVRVHFRLTLHNPPDNHDKLVNLSLDVLKGDAVVKSTAISGIDIEEDTSDEEREVSMVLKTSDLDSEPPPTLRITMTAVNN